MSERIIAYFRGELSEKERIDLLREVQSDDALKKKMSSYQNMRALTALAPEAVDFRAGQAAYRRLMQQRRKRKVNRIIRSSMGYAAAIGLLVAVTWAVAVSFCKQSAQVLVAQQELYVPAGQRARITLPDGSQVWLNAGSTLSYPSVFGAERRVRLTGEGYFDVAKQPDHPFIVSTGQVEIKALGTQFNVYSYPQAAYMSTLLMEGSVKVYRPDDEQAGMVLHPHEQLVYESSQFRVERITDTDQLLWREGVYSFKKEKLGDIIKKLELYYDVEILVKDPSILQYEYTGKFRQRDGVYDILCIIQKIHLFRIEKDEDLNRITLYK